MRCGSAYESSYGSAGLFQPVSRDLTSGMRARRISIHLTDGCIHRVGYFRRNKCSRVVIEIEQKVEKNRELKQLAEIRSSFTILAIYGNSPGFAHHQSHQ
jgi:hypothetical protein